MALLIGAGMRVFDAAGNLINGGKIRVYDAGTTNLSSIYSNAGLSSALTNPCVSSSSGWPSSNGTTPCAIYAASGSYDVAFLDDDDSVFASFASLPTVGEEGADFTRTVTGGGRILITGAAGAVLIQAGDPSPDNTGGTLTLEGWAGTQLDTLTLDGAVVNTTGRLKENSRKITGTVQTEATAFSAAATVDIPLTNTPSGVRRWRVTIFDLFPSVNSTPQLKISYSGSVKSGASDYAYDTIYWNVAGSTYGRGFDDANTLIAMSGDVFTNQTNKPAVLVIEIITPNSGNDATVVSWRGSHYTNEGTPRPGTISGTGYGLGNFGRADAIQLLGSAGTWTGKYVVEALAGYGD